MLLFFIVSSFLCAAESNNSKAAQTTLTVFLNEYHMATQSCQHHKMSVFPQLNLSIKSHDFYCSCFTSLLLDCPGKPTAGCVGSTEN